MTYEEYEEMKRHSLEGAKKIKTILENVEDEYYDLTVEQTEEIFNQLGITSQEEQKQVLEFMYSIGTIIYNNKG